MGFFEDLNIKTELNAKLNRTNKDIEKFLTDLGWQYYNAHKDEPSEDFKELIETLNSAFAKKRDLEMQLAWVRGVTVCQNCGSEISLDLNFCTSCGTKLIKPEPVAPPVVQPTPPTVEQPVVQPVITQNDRFCAVCGNRVSPNATFCTQCGSKL